MVALVPGTFSGVGRRSDAQLAGLRKETSHETEQTTVTAKSKHSKGSRAVRALSKASSAPALTEGPQGDLARAVQERERINAELNLRRKQDEAAAAAAAEEELLHDRSRRHLASRGSDAAVERPTAAFAPGIFHHEAVWAGKLTASNSPGALNRLKTEQRPDPCHYRIRNLDAFLNRAPAWGITPPREPRPPKKGEEPDGTFLTGTGDEGSSPEASSSRRRRAHEPPAKRSASEPKSSRYGKTAMALAAPRGDLGKIGRKHVIMNEVSAPSKDLPQQDIVGYSKERPPRWDFGRPLGRQPLIKSDEEMHIPGRYDPNWDSVQPKIHSGCNFELQPGPWLDRSRPEFALGHGALEFGLYPDVKKGPGGVFQDRSCGKDGVRPHRVHVNNFDRELARPDPKFKGELSYHREDDPIACALTLHREVTYNADQACIPVRARKDRTLNMKARQPRKGTDTIGPRAPFVLPEGRRESSIRPEHNLQNFEPYSPSNANGGLFVRDVSPAAASPLRKQAAPDAARFLREDKIPEGFTVRPQVDGRSPAHAARSPGRSPPGRGSRSRASFDAQMEAWSP